MVSRLPPDASEGLAPLAAFEHLRWLLLDRVSAVDLSPLGGLALERLRIDESARLDLAPLSAIKPLESLKLIDLKDCYASSPLRLEALRELNLSTDRRGLPGDSVRAAIEAIDWSRLGHLRSLGLRVGGLETLAPIKVDLGLLRELPRLERLEITGVWHDSSGPNPLEPPFEGLPPGLTWLRFPAADHEALEAAIRRHFGVTFADIVDGTRVVVVYPRGEADPKPSSWVLLPPEGDGDWCTYGSLADRFDTETEHEAVNLARRAIRDHDQRLLSRLDFDQESSGTGIMATDLADLEAALAILGLP
jgi:hypothetical protein